LFGEDRDRVSVGLGQPARHNIDFCEFGEL